MGIGDSPGTGTDAGRLAFQEAKVEMLEKQTAETFREVKESVRGLDSTLSTVNHTLVSLNERMVTKDDLASKQASCQAGQRGTAEKLDGRLDDLEQDAALARQREDLTSPGLRVPMKNGITAAKAKKWLGVAAAVLGLLGFTSVSTCVSSTMGDVKTTMQRNQKVAEMGQAELREKMQQMQDAPPTQLLPLPQPIIIAPDSGLTRSERRYIERRRRWLRSHRPTTKRAPRRAPASQPIH